MPGALSTGKSIAGPKINQAELVMITVIGTVASPIAGPVAYRIGQDGTPRILPGTGGIVLSHRVGDLCVGIAGDLAKVLLALAIALRLRNRTLGLL